MVTFVQASAQLLQTNVRRTESLDDTHLRPACWAIKHVCSVLAVFCNNSCTFIADFGKVVALLSKCNIEYYAIFDRSLHK